MRVLPPTIFESTPVAADDPLLARPYSPLPLEALVEAARIVTAHPTMAAIQKFRRHVVTLRITESEYRELVDAHAAVRVQEISHTPQGLHSS